MNWGCLPKTVTRMDAGVKPPGRVLRCLLPNLCLEQGKMKVNLATIRIKHKIISVNGTAVILEVKLFYRSL